MGSACSKNSDDLLKKVAALSANKDKVKEAQAVVKALAASRRSRSARAALTSCTEVKTVAVQLTAFVLEFPGAPDILVYSAKIIASSSVVCTAAEKIALAEVDAAFDEAVTFLDDAVEAAHDELMELTGTTPPPDVVAAAQSTTAAGASSSAAAGDSTPAPGDSTPPAGDSTPAPGDSTPPADGDSTPADGDSTPADGDSTPA